MQLSEFRDLLANDGFAATFQTMGQYRTELLRALDKLRAQADARPVAWSANWIRDQIADQIDMWPLATMTVWQIADHVRKIAITAPEAEASAPGLSEPAFWISKSDADWLERVPNVNGQIQALRLGGASRVPVFLTRASAATVAEPSDTLPERDQSKPAEQQGLFRKFIVQRVDGSDAPGGKHHGCEYFVLDMTHDQHAAAALRAYAEACAVTHPQLSADLRARHGAAQQQAEPTVQRCTSCGGAKVPQTLLATGACDCEQAEPGADERAAVEFFTLNPSAAVLALKQWLGAQSGQRAGVAEGWRFYSADFSITAHQPSQPGYVMLIRDEIGYKKWHSMDEAVKEEIPLFITGRGVTFEKALLHANENAIAAAPTQQQEG